MRLKTVPRVLLLAMCCIAALILQCNPARAVTLVPCLSNTGVVANLTGTPGETSTFKVAVRLQPPFPITCVLTDFDVQPVVGNFPVPGASFRPPMGWIFDAPASDPLTSTGHFEALTPASGIAQGHELDGFQITFLPANIPDFGFLNLRIGDISTTMVPEPSSAILLAIGLAIGAWVRRRRISRSRGSETLGAALEPRGEPLSGAAAS